MTSSPILTIQTASLWSSGDDSTFTGTGGPGYDPFFDAFNGVVSSQIIAAEPFDDTLEGVEAGDQVVFVIAVQNFANATPAYDLTLRDLVPVGFEIPPDGADLLVTDGAGNVLDSSGDLFDPNGGLVIDGPIGAYSDSSGANVALVTFTLQATSTIAVPLANITNTAQIASYAASEGGANLAGSSTTVLSATTPVTTDGITVTSAADQATTTLGSGQTASFDITITLPEGTAQNLQINESMPLSGSAGLSLVSAQIVQFGSDITATLPVMTQPNGSILLGNVTDTNDGIESAEDQIVVRLTVTDGGGTAAGTGTINTVVSAANPNAAGQNWSTTVTNTVPLAKPDVPPTIAGVSPAQNTTDTLPVFPFATLLLADPDIGQTETMTIHLSDPSLGTLGGVAGLSTDPSGDYVLSGSVAAVQSDMRGLLFTPTDGAVGTETLGLTLNDGNTGIATNQNTTVSIAASANPSDFMQFPISTQTVLTSTVTGSSTLNAVQVYLGPIDNVQTQFLYDGTAPLAIVAQQSNMLISSNADATAIQLQGGDNLVDVGAGSTFVTSGSGDDVFLFQAAQAQPTWNTIINFHPGDSITVYGFDAATSSDYWDPSAGASGYTGATLRMDLNRDGTVDSSITFAGKTSANIGNFSLTTGSVAGENYLVITETA
jgi:hypothetical protein